MRRITLLLCVLCMAFWLSSCTTTTANTSSSATPTASATMPVKETPTVKAEPGSALAVAEEFYTAMKMKEYSKAYSYFEPGAVTIQGRQLTEANFKQLAQARDQLSGPIKSYSAEASKTDPTLVAVAVSRAKDKHYTVHMHVKGGKITSIDSI